VQNLLSSRLLSKNTKIQIYRIIIFHVVLYGCETWSFTLRDESRPKMFENRVFRRIFGPKKNEVRREWRKLRNEELNDGYFSPNIVRVMKTENNKMVGSRSMYGGAEVCIGFWWGNFRERDHLEDQGINGRIILKRIFRK